MATENTNTEAAVSYLGMSDEQMLETGVPDVPVEEESQEEETQDDPPDVEESQESNSEDNASDDGASTDSDPNKEDGVNDGVDTPDSKKVTKLPERYCCSRLRSRVQPINGPIQSQW